MSRSLMLSRKGRGWRPKTLSDQAAYDIIRAPLITEKATLIGEQGQFAFKVALEANKFEIKQAIEKLFKVDVVSVNTLRTKGKVKRFRGRLGQRNDWKKAIVTLKAGQSIDLTATV